jgi:putative spermidine/putrescine transport system substrate-binding protein
MKKKFTLFTLLILPLFTVNVYAQINLTILCWEGYAPKQHISNFTQFINKKYGIDLKIKVNNVVNVQDFFNGIRSRNVDIISPAHNIPNSARWPFIKANIVLPLNLNNIPNYKKLNPALHLPKYLQYKGDVYGVPLVYGVYGLAYNTNKVNPAPDSWQVFWQTKFNKKFAISAEYYEANIYITALSLGYSKQQIYDYELLRSDAKFTKRLAQLASSADLFWQGVDKPDDLLNQSLATAWGFSFPKLKAKGQIWKFATPKEGSTAWVDNWLIGYSLKDSPLKKKIAEEWINYTLSDEMQLYYFRELGQLPTSMSIAKYLSQAEIDELHVNDVDYIKNSLNLWEILTNRQQNGFKKLWQDAKKQANTNLTN